MFRDCFVTKRAGSPYCKTSETNYNTREQFVNRGANKNNFNKIRAMFGNLFKSPQQREAERNTAIRQSINLQRQQVKKLEKHERDYMEKALRAKSKGDAVNFKQLCTLIARTVNNRRALESQTLRFEMMLQTRDQARMMKEFAEGMKAMAKSIGNAFKDFNAAEMVQSFDEAVAKQTAMESEMNLVLDNIQAYEESADIPEGGLSADAVEKMLGEKAALENDSVDKQIEAGLAAIRATLLNSEQKG